MFFDVKTTEEFNELTTQSKICVVDFYASWCHPCKEASIELEQKVKENNELFMHVSSNNNPYNKTILFVKVNIDNFSDLVEIFELSSIPFFAFFKNGKLQKENVNGNDVDSILNILQKLLK